MQQHNRLSARRTWHGRVPAPHQIASALGLYMDEASVVSAAVFVSVSVSVALVETVVVVVLIAVYAAVDLYAAVFVSLAGFVSVSVPLADCVRRTSFVL